MSSRKNKATSGASSKKNDDQQRENILQAVVLTDSYQTRFRPLTLETPRCLLPLANIPLIDYTLEFLSLAGVEEVFIFASAHADLIERYIRNSKWNKRSSPFKQCKIVMSTSSMSLGDAMRELDAKSMITTDFLLVNGDFVSNLPLEGLLEEHRRRRTRDKNAIMTMVLREAGYEHRAKARGEAGVFVIDEATKRCVHYEEMRPGTEEHMVSLPPELTKQHPQLRIRSDLIDCQVDICSPDVPALFTENFDYQHIRRHFLHGILTDYELYGKTIHTHIVSDGYAARVRSLQTYDAVSRDIVGRWTYPLVPDNNLGLDQNYALGRGNIYREEGVVLARNCVLKKNTILGRGTVIGDGSVVSNSVIGSGSTIGKDVVLENAYIWDNVVIGDGCKINNSIIANDAVLGKNCHVKEGTVVSYGVEFADGTETKPYSRITGHKKRKAHTNGIRSNRELDEDAAVDIPSFSGSEYDGSESESDAEHISAVQDRLSYTHLNMSTSSISTLPEEDSSLESASSLDGFSPSRKSVRSDSFASFEDADESWYREASTSLLNAMEGDHPVAVASLELNGLRMTANAPWHQVRRAVVTALITRIEQVVILESLTNKVATKNVAERWLEIINRCIHERKDQSDFLLLAQKECCGRKAGESLLLNFVQVLNYDLEIIDEEAVHDWWLNEASTKDDKMKAVRKPTEAFVKWLSEAESESEESGEEGDGEESDEE